MGTIMVTLGPFLLRCRLHHFLAFLLYAMKRLTWFTYVPFMCCLLSSCAIKPSNDNRFLGDAINNTHGEIPAAASPTDVVALPESSKRSDDASEEEFQKQRPFLDEPASASALPPSPPSSPSPATSTPGNGSRGPASAPAFPEPQQDVESLYVVGAPFENHATHDSPSSNHYDYYQTDEGTSIDYEAVEGEEISDIEVIPVSASIPSASVDELYKIELAVDKNMKIPGIKGELRVWIGGIDEYTASPQDFAINTSHIHAIADFVLVTPRAPDFEIDAHVNDNSCFEIHPTGSTVRFTLTPKKAGVFRVSADIKFFQTPDCSGAHVPKAAETLSVNVEVDRLQVMYGKVGELGDILWHGVLEFWKGLVALIIGLFLFLIRKRLAAWFGYHAK